MSSLLVNAVQSVVSLLIGAVASALLSIVLYDQIMYFAAFILSPVAGLMRGGRYRIAGIWEAAYPEVEVHRSERTEVKHLIKLKQLGPFVIGKNIEGETTYWIRGRIHQRLYLSGTWSDRTRADHHGAFQLCLENGQHLTRMRGKWIGFSLSRPGLINDGSWDWELRSHG